MNNEEKYAAFSKNPDRIEGSIHNTATVRLGVGFNFQTMESVDAIELAFTNEPHGNMRSILVVNMTAARALRDRLNAVIREHERDICRARRQAARATREK